MEGWVDQEGELFRLLAENVPDCAVFALDATGRVQSWNAGAQRLLGYSQEEIVGQSTHIFFTPEDLQDGAPKRELAQALETGRSADHHWCVRKDGSRFWSSNVTTPLRDEAGALRGFAKIVRDRTSALSKEEANQEANALFRSVVQSNMIGIGFWDREGNITDANELLLQMIGYSREEILAGQVRWTDLTPPEYHARDEQALAQTVRQGACDPYEKEWIRKDGTRFPILLGGSHLEGDPNRGAFWAVDITERKRAERAFQVQARVLESMAEGVSLSDEQGVILYTNPAEDAIFGYEQGELIGQHVSVQNTYPPEENARMVAEVIRHLKTHGAWEGEFENRKKDGTPFTTRARITALELDDRPHWVCVQEDITDRRRASQQLANSEERLRLALQAGRMGAWDWNIPTGQVAWSEYLIALHGLTADKFDGTIGAFQRLVHPEDLETVQSAIQAAIEHRAPFDVEFRIVWPDGSVHWLAGKGKAFYDEQGAPSHMVGIGMDITERREAAERLRQSEERFRGLMEQAPFSIQVIACNGKTLQVNRAWEELWGANLDLLADYNMLEDAQLEAKGILPQLRRAFAGDAVHLAPIQYDPNETLPNSSGHQYPRRWVSAVAYPIKDHAGNVREVILVHQDITARQRAEDALRESEERFRGMVSHSVAGVAEVDLSGRYLFCNDRYCEIVGRSRDELMQLRMQDITHRDDLRENLPLFERLVKTGTPFTIEKRYLRPDGVAVWVNNSVSGIRDHDGRVTSIAAVCVDITARHEAEEALRQADRRKDEFLAMLAHELRNPLAPIRTGLDILALGQSTPEVVGLMQQQVTHLVRLVDDLLDVSRIMRGRIELRPEVVELSQVVKHAVETARPLIDRQQHRLTCSLPPEPIWLHADPVRLAQVVANLLNNAAKYTDRGGQIALAAAKHGEHVLIRVSDNGVGMEPELLRQAFDLFTQGNRSLDRSQGGLGIGLTVVKNLVEMHGGTVSAHSAGPGQGSEFTVRLPILSQSSPARDKTLTTAAQEAR